MCLCGIVRENQILLCYVLNDCFSVSAAERVESVVESLKEEYGEHVWVLIPFSITCFWLVMIISYEMLMMLKNYRQGTKCDVREGKDVRELVGYCQNNLKYIDIWVYTSFFFLYELAHVVCVCAHFLNTVLRC